ncbi:MAG: DUF4350 domain-containing protein [Burkholderiales bacterium]
MNRRSLIVPAIVLLVGGIAVWLLHAIEHVPQRVWVGFQGEARRNPWHAAELLLARMGRQVQPARSVPALKALPADGVLLLPRRLGAISVAEQRALLDWVARGGHLIVEAEAPRQPDPILDALGVTRRTLNARGPSRFVYPVLPGAPAPLKVEIGEWRTLEAKAKALAFKGTQATYLLHLEHGAGRVSAITDLGFAGNLAIRHHDHAGFLWRLVQMKPGAGTVSFFHSPVRLSLTAWLQEHAWTAIVAGALLLALWLWRIVPRFGPVAPDPEPARRRLLDHLRASGRFQWSAGGGAELAEAAREAALRHVMRAHPEFAALDGAEREARLAALFALAPEDARRVLHPATHARHAAHAPHIAPAALVAAASVYQAIHEQLTQTRGRR